MACIEKCAKSEDWKAYLSAQTRKMRLSIHCREDTLSGKVQYPTYACTLYTQAFLTVQNPAPHVASTEVVDMFDSGYRYASDTPEYAMTGNICQKP